MIGSFSFRGIPSSQFGLICQSVSRPLLPAIKSNLINLSGVSGVYDTGIGTYDIRTIAMRIQFQAPETTWESGFYNVRKKAREIAEWLGNGEWGKLVITGEEDKYYWAKMDDNIDLQVAMNFGVADISFKCQPFAYSMEDLTFRGESPLHIDNPGTRLINYRSPLNSKFDITFTSTELATFTMNGNTITHQGNGTFTLDNVNMTISNSIFSNLSGDIDQFLTVNPGENILESIGATDISVVIRPMFY